MSPDPELIPDPAPDADDDKGRRLWRQPGESMAAGGRTPEFEAPAIVGEADRRAFMKFMAASMALAGLSGCGPDEEAVPYVEAPETVIPARPTFYATAVGFAGFAQPVIGRTSMGRPTKLEANRRHPGGIAGTDAFTQAAVLALYDPDRSRAPLHLGRETSWTAVADTLAERARMLDAKGGQGLRILTGAITSPTLYRQLTELERRWPAARWHWHEPFGDDRRHAATRAALGRPLDLHYRLDRAEIVVAIDDDLLGPGARQAQRMQLWAAGRREAQGGAVRRLHVVEPLPTLTGIRATSLRRVAPSAVPAHLLALAAALGAEDETATVPDEARAWAAGMAAELRAHPGRGLIAVGAHLPPAYQALGLRLNAMLGNLGTCMRLSEPVQAGLDDGDRSLAGLARDMQAGTVETLFVLEANPAYTAPRELGFAQAMNQVPFVVHAGLSDDETAARSHWHLALGQALDSWGDLRSVDGTATIVQPLVRPFYSVRGAPELLAMLGGDPDPDGRAIVQATWRAAWGLDGEAFERRWRQSLADGFVEGTASQPVEPPAPRAVPRPAAASAPRDGLEVVIGPDPTIWDGRFANLAWLQELPKPITKLTWDNVVAIAPALARARGLENGDLVALEAEGARIEGPVWIVPGQAAGAVGLTAGYGRTRVGRVGEGAGFDAGRLPFGGASWLAGVRMDRLDRRVQLATTQPHHRIDGDDLIRKVAHGGDQPVRREASGPSMYRPWPEGDRQWGMSIDLDLCTGCNACVTACQAENNIAVVGKEQVRQGREMFWLRVDHYYEGPPDDPKAYFQPVPCMHCEQAPCEMGCPVNATVHDSEGLNDMVYNRCIGTRTCSAYCPYKVRHFNWYDYTADDPPSIQAQRNPNVTVRARGVMEKCTYCVQRISEARIAAKKEQRPIRDGEVVTACQQACPAGAIDFGNLADRSSSIAERKRSPRSYGLLEEQGTRPRTTYLALVEDGEPEAGDG